MSHGPKQVSWSSPESVKGGYTGICVIWRYHRGYGEVRHAGCHYCNNFWVSMVAQSVKTPPAMQETWVQSLGWEDPLEKEIAT